MRKCVNAYIVHNYIYEAHGYSSNQEKSDEIMDYHFMLPSSLPSYSFLKELHRYTRGCSYILYMQYRLTALSLGILLKDLGCTP